ncbi:acyl-CoA thioester hydrolase YciA, partial [Yersinia enterocolitica]
MSQMDIGGAIQAKEIAHGRVVTVRVDGMTFLKPVAVGDVVCCYAGCIKTGRSSITINIEVWVKKVSSEPIGQRYKATEAVFTYVAVDDIGKARAL